MKVVDSTIAGNRIGTASGISTLASDVDGGAIYSLLGDVTVVRSRIADNDATATGPTARFAEGGAMFIAGSGFDMRDSVVSGNRAELASQLPADVEQLANAGGIHVTGDVAESTIERSAFTGNSTRATNSSGDAIAFSGGLHVDSPVDFTMTGGVIAGNRSSAATVGASTGVAHADGGGGQLFGTMRHTLVRGNQVDATAAAGRAEAQAGGTWALFGDIRASAITGNRMRAVSPAGTAVVSGAGALVDADPEIGQGGLTLTGSLVAGNRGTARGATEIAQGGGLFDVAGDPFPFGGPLALIDSAVVGNTVRGDVAQGGGVFLRGPAVHAHPQRDRPQRARPVLRLRRDAAPGRGGARRKRGRPGRRPARRGGAAALR